MSEGLRIRSARSPQSDVADLVLLEADPMEDMRKKHRFLAVGDDWMWMPDPSRPVFNLGLFAALAIPFCLACDPSPGAPVLDLPPRPAGAPGGDQVAREIRELVLDAREERLYTEISSGNVPTWLRRLERVEMTGGVGGRERTVTFWVTPDYLAVGSADDHLLVPLSPQVAQRIADLVGGSLPTPRMVDAVWKSARYRLSPIRFPADELMASVEYFERHNRLVRAQRFLRDIPPDGFIAGHKKDVVLSAQLSANPGRVAVYGQHLLDGKPFQPVSTALEESWVAYNHGVRLVDRTILIDGARQDLADVLRDPELAPLLTDGGPLREARYPLSRGKR